MRKLKLNLHDLRVETFAAGEREPEPGTVRANMPMKIDDGDNTDTGGGSGGTYWDCTTPKTCWYTCGIDYCTDMTCFASMCNATFCCG